MGQDNEIQCGDYSKANSVIVREDGSRDVIHWRLGDHTVPAVHRVRETVVRYPVMYYTHANYGAEVMAIRSENIARLRWSSTSFDLPLPPETTGHFNLLSEAVKVIYKEFHGSPTEVTLQYPAMIKLQSTDAWHDRFRIYLNLHGFEFYHLLFVIGSAFGPSSQYTVEAADVSTCPKLLAWLRPFETAKKKLYQDNEFDWNPRRGPIELGPTKDDL